MSSLVLQSCQNHNALEGNQRLIKEEAGEVQVRKMWKGGRDPLGAGGRGRRGQGEGGDFQ
jgi:hypothetical protein